MSTDKIISDVMLIAGNDEAPQSPPDNYTLLGHWDVDKGGGTGTDESRGHYMIGLYARFESKDQAHASIEDICLKSSNNNTPPLPPLRYDYYGCWDVAKGGSRGTDNSQGHHMMGFYVKKNGPSSDRRLIDIQLKASDSSNPPPGPDGYTQLGYWDVDSGGSQGTDNSTGRNIMAMYAKFDGISPDEAPKAFPISASQPLSIIAGQVNANGTKESGLGFESKRVSTGCYRIELEKGRFSSKPVVVASIADLKDDNTISAFVEWDEAARSARVTVHIFDNDPRRNIPPEDGSFTFIATGT